MSAGEALKLEVEGLEYTLDALPRPGRKVVLVARTAAGGARGIFSQVVDLFGFRPRHRLARSLGEQLGRDPERILGHLALLLDQVERALAQTAPPAPDPKSLPDARRSRAEELLRAPDLLDRAAAALEALGYVGEEATKRLVYLVTTSRLLPRPLSAILLAPTGAGKSELLDKVAQLLPPEAMEYLSRLTPSALYYAGPDHLRNKVIMVDEQAGAAEADYSIRTLQTKGYLRLAVPIHGHTEKFEAHGPIALLSGTTRSDLDPENLSRCLELALDDSPEQTRRIQEAQRAAWTGARAPEVQVEVWQDVQRLLEPREVVIPFAMLLDFPARTTTDRREQQKLLSLVAAHALLSQRLRQVDGGGRVVATIADYSAVHALLARHVERGTDGLSPRAIRALRLLEEAETPLSRRELAERVGWNYMTAARALDELLAQELVHEVARGLPRRYCPLQPSARLGGVTLMEPAALAAAHASAGSDTFTSFTASFTPTEADAGAACAAGSQGFTAAPELTISP